MAAERRVLQVPREGRAIGRTLQVIEGTVAAPVRLHLDQPDRLATHHPLAGLGHLFSTGWFYQKDDAQSYDRARALFPADVLAWVKNSQPKAWDALEKTHGAAAEGMLLDRIRKQLSDRGTLDVLRHGVEMIGLEAPLALAQFKPALAMNDAIMARYQANRLRVVRELRYSQANENCIDLVLFLNGLPVATAELKTDFRLARPPRS